LPANPQRELTLTEGVAVQLEVSDDFPLEVADEIAVPADPLGPNAEAGASFAAILVPVDFGPNVEIFAVPPVPPPPSQLPSGQPKIFLCFVPYHDFPRYRNSALRHDLVSYVGSVPCPRDSVPFVDSVLHHDFAIPSLTDAEACLGVQGRRWGLVVSPRHFVCSSKQELLLRAHGHLRSWVDVGAQILSD